MNKNIDIAVETSVYNAYSIKPASHSATVRTKNKEIYFIGIKPLNSNQIDFNNIKEFHEHIVKTEKYLDMLKDVDDKLISEVKKRIQ